MPIKTDVLSEFIAAFIGVATRIKPDVKKSYKAQRVVEDLTGRINLPDLRCRIENTVARMPDGYEVPLRIFTPLDIDFSPTEGLTVTEDSRGTILFFHGGGWVNGSVDSYEDACTTMAIRLERRVVAVDYRRAPEHRFPQAPEDCYEVARQLFAGQILEDVDPAHVVLFGDSAGGNLSAVVSIMARDRREFSPPTQMLLYPATYNDHTPSSIFDSVRENGSSYLLTWQEVEDTWACTSPTLRRKNPYFAPLLNPISRANPARSCSRRSIAPCATRANLCRTFGEDGCDVTCYRVYDAIHGYLLYPSVFASRPTRIVSSSIP